MTRLGRLAIIVVGFAWWPFAAEAAGPSTKPGPVATSKPAKTTKYPVPTDKEVAESKSLMTSLFGQAAKDVNPKLHKVESAHFIIFSGLAKDVDKDIGDTMERMYQTLCKQFNVEEGEHVWVGKCGVFLLTKDPAKQFFTFATKVDHLDAEKAAGAGGYFRCSDIQAYIVMPPPPDGRQAREMECWRFTLVHESTHAFLYRYLGDKPVPLWLNEGIADTIACQVMNSKILDKQMRQSNKEVLMPGDFKDPSSVFRTVGLSPFDYGIAQSWVRFLVAKDPKAFLKFVALCKEGQEDEPAMKEAYKMSHADFLKAWADWAKNMR